MEKEEAELVPEGLVSCLLDGNQVNILKISPQSLTIRVSEEIKVKPVIKAAFYIFDEYRYEEVSIEDYSIAEKSSSDFYEVYTFAIENKEYAHNVRNVFKDYSRYVRLKNYGIDNEFSQEMVSYPAELDYDFYSYYADQKREWMSDLNYKDYQKGITDNVEIAVSLHDDNLYKKYLAMDIKDFKEYYLAENYLENEGIFAKDIERLYIGNEFCHNLFPNLRDLLKMMEKAEDEKLKITICFTYMRECFIEKTREILDEVYTWCSENDYKIEIVVNDWGMLKLLEGKDDYFKLSLGVLLNKRKKDPRYNYKKGYSENKELMAENSLNSPLVNDFLNKLRIDRYEYENCGYQMKIAPGHHSLHLPFYVTNTSQYCPLYAMCKYQDRGRQQLVKNCPKYCRDYIFSYPKHLKMVGRYNSLFAFDDTLLKDEEKLQYYINNNVDRIVLNFM